MTHPPPPPTPPHRHTPSPNPPSPPGPIADPDAHLDADLLPLAASLAALGAAERDATPAGLDRRLLASTLPALREGSPEHVERPGVIARIGSDGRHGRLALRLAAAIALVATVIAGATLIMSSRPAPAIPVADRSTEAIIEEIDTELDEWLADLEAIDDIYTESDTTSMDEFWNLNDSLTLSEEATS